MNKGNAVSDPIHERMKADLDRSAHTIGLCGLGSSFGTFAVGTAGHLKGAFPIEDLSSSSIWTTYECFSYQRRPYPTP